MPYIAPQDRPQFDEPIDLLGAGAQAPGELAYIVSRLLHVYIYENQKDQSYADLAEVLAVLETCKFEYYTNTMKPYEDYKRRTNGDLFDHHTDMEGTNNARGEDPVGGDIGLAEDAGSESPGGLGVGLVRKAA